MSFRLAIGTAAAVLAAGGLAAGSAGGEQQYGTAKSTEMGVGIHMISTGIAGNLALLTGDDGVVMVDDQLPNTGSLIEGAVVEIGVRELRPTQLGPAGRGGDRPRCPGFHCPFWLGLREHRLRHATYCP